jgi:hypothetical protein
VIGERHQELRRGPWDVEEKADAVPAGATPQCVAQRDQVIVVNPDEIVPTDQRGEAVGKSFVDPLVPDRGRALVFGQVEPVVKQRPERGIGVAVVVFGDILRGQVDGRHGHAIVVGERRFGRRFGRFVARPAEPQAARLPQCGVERPGQAALRSGRTPSGRDGDPVRYDDKAAHGRTIGSYSSFATTARRS